MSCKKYLIFNLKLTLCSDKGKEILQLMENENFKANETVSTSDFEKYLYEENWNFNLEVKP